MLSTSYRTARIIIPVSLTAFFLGLSTRYWGIPLDDDSLYMGDRKQVNLSWLITHHDWGALYALWFKLLGIFCHDPVALFFLSWILLIVLVALIPTLFRMPAAWLYTLIILTLPLTTDGPYVGLFASTILLAGVCWLLRKRLSFAEGAFTACVLSFCITFCRPEYNYGVLICAAATVIAVVVEWAGDRSTANERSAGASKAPAWLMLLVAVVISGTVLVLLRNAPSQRSGMAFAQHFNIRSAFRGEIPLGPESWRSNYAELRFGVDTSHNAGNGTAKIGEFFHANPRLFFRQIFDNVTDRHTIFLMIYVLAVVTLPWVKKDLAVWRPASLFMLLLSVPPLAGSVIIFPHSHYAVILVPSLTIFALQLLNPERWLRPSIPWVLVPGLALLGYIYFVRPQMEKTPMSFARLNLRRIQCIRRWDEPVAGTNPSVFSINDIAPAYVDTSRTLVFPPNLATWDQFQSWAVQKQPAWISVDTSVSLQYGYVPLATQYGVSPEQLAAFLQNDLGYTPHPCSVDAQLTVYTHNER